jgi:hypothetical protein
MLDHQPPSTKSTPPAPRTTAQGAAPPALVDAAPRASGIRRADQLGAALGRAVMARSASMAAAATSHPTLQRVHKKSGSSNKQAKNKARVVGKAKAKQRKLNKSFENLDFYRPNWVGQHGITEYAVEQFVASFGEIPGHHSGDNTKGENDNTTRQLRKFLEWFTGG